MVEPPARRLIYSLLVSLDGYINGGSNDGEGDGGDDQLLRFINEQQRNIDTGIFGRRMYEVMKFWDTAEELHSLGEEDVNFARQWKRQRKIVVSSTLESVSEDAELVDEPLVDIVARLKSQPGGDIEIAGATIAGSAIKHGLVDEIRLFVEPKVNGGGTPFFPLGTSLKLDLIETKTFDSGIVYLGYRSVSLH